MMSIRRAEIADIRDIKAVLALTWRDAYSSLLSETSLAKVTAEWHSPEVLEEEINRPSTFFAVATSPQSRIVGIITAHAHAEVLWVARLYVLPEFQRQGIGRMLMNECYRAFPQMRQVRLNVEEQNPKGRAFYRKLGFTEVGLRTDDVAGTTLNSVVMERNLHKFDDVT